MQAIDFGSVMGVPELQNIQSKNLSTTQAYGNNLADAVGGISDVIVGNRKAAKQKTADEKYAEIMEGWDILGTDEATRARKASAYMAPYDRTASEALAKYAEQQEMLGTRGQSSLAGKQVNVDEKVKDRQFKLTIEGLKNDNLLKRMVADQSFKEKMKQTNPRLLESMGRLEAAISGGDRTEIMNATIEYKTIAGQSIVDTSETIIGQGNLRQRVVESVEKEKQNDATNAMREKELAQRKKQQQDKDKREGQKIAQYQISLALKAELAAHKAKAAQKEKKYNDGQYLSAGFALRMQEAEKIIQGLESGWLKIGGAVPSALRGEESALLSQATKNFINAQLRKESGASIGTEEFGSANSQYMPELGDTKSVIEQKRANRLQAIAAMRSNSAGAINEVYEEYDKLLGDDKISKGVSDEEAAD